MKYLIHTNAGFQESPITIHLYDIVSLRYGTLKNELAIIEAIVDDNITCRILKYGISVCCKIKGVSFVNHNTTNAAKVYFKLCDAMYKNCINNYTDKHYVIKNWFTDKFICNDITAVTLCKELNIFLTDDEEKYNAKAVNWLAENMSTIGVAVQYDDINFVQLMYLNNKLDEHFNIELYKKLHHYFYE